MCCGLCLCKIKDKGKGQHNNCEACILESIQEEKKNKLFENILILKNFSNNIEDSINKLNNFFKELNEKKENLKLEIQNTFTKIRSMLNEREDELLLKVDNLYDKTYFEENLIKESEKLTNKVKTSLDIGEELNKKWEKENLNLLINECINIENNVTQVEDQQHLYRDERSKAPYILSDK
mgnify:CR=1 FL=1